MKKKTKIILLAITALFLTQCANVVTPTGGPKDITPPKVVSAIPENHSVHFSGKKIEITFDEYITLENAQQNVLFSPPLTTKPDIKLNNKTVVIKFKENLIPNVTYTVHFGSSIKDLHEGNIFKDYIYSFSTGEQLDTLMISGKVIDAESKKPVEDILVGAYSGECDSLFDQPTKKALEYLTKTDKDGHFTLHGLPDKKFLVFALKDMNSNLYYDMPNEMVAFLDTLVPASFPQLPPKENETLTGISDTITTMIDSVPMAADTLFLDADTIPVVTDTLMERWFDSKALDLTLYAFAEEDTNQMLLEKKLVEEGMLRFVFRQPADRVQIEVPDPLPDTFQLVKIWSAEHDTACWYFTPNVMDSLRVYIQYDTLINDSTIYSLKYRETKLQGRKTSKALKISNNLKNNLLMPDDNFVLRFSEPIVSILWHDTSTFTMGDTVLYNKLDFKQADEYGMEYRLDTAWVDTLEYGINIPDSVFFSIRGRTNDSIHLRFKKATEHDFGNIFIIVEPPENTQLVIQLVDSHDKVVQTQIIDQEQRVEFKQLLPEKYKLRAIIDTDRNGKWSTGNYHRRFLPETVEEYKDALDLKGGWDIDLEEKWILFSE